MNLARFTCHMVCASAGIALVACTFSTHAADVPGSFWNVVSLTGAARCMVGTNAIHPLTRGQSVGPGTLVQLAGGNSMADLAVEPRGPRLTMYADSIVVFSNATSEVAGAATNSPTFQVIQFELRAGKILVKGGNSAANQITEISLPFGLVRSQGGQYFVSAEEKLGVISGKALIAVTNMVNAVEVPAGYQWSPATGLVVLSPFEPGSAPPMTPPTTATPRATTPSQPNPSRPNSPSGPPPLPHRVF